MVNGPRKKGVLVGRKANGRRIEADGLDVEDGMYVVPIVPGDQFWMVQTTPELRNSLQIPDQDQLVIVVQRGDGEQRKKKWRTPGPPAEFYPTGRVILKAVYDCGLARMFVLDPSGLAKGNGESAAGDEGNGQQ